MHHMEVSDQLHALAFTAPRRDLPVPTGQEGK